MFIFRSNVRCTPTLIRLSTVYTQQQYEEPTRNDDETDSIEIYKARCKNLEKTTQELVQENNKLKKENDVMYYTLRKLFALEKARDRTSTYTANFDNDAYYIFILGKNWKLIYRVFHIGCSISANEIDITKIKIDLKYMTKYKTFLYLIFNSKFNI